MGPCCVVALVGELGALVHDIPTAEIDPVRTGLVVVEDVRAGLALVRKLGALVHNTLNAEMDSARMGLAAASAQLAVDVDAVVRCFAAVTMAEMVVVALRNPSLRAYYCWV